MGILERADLPLPKNWARNCDSSSGAGRAAFRSSVFAPPQTSSRTFSLRGSDLSIRRRLFDNPLKKTRTHVLHSPHAIAPTRPRRSTSTRPGALRRLPRRAIARPGRPAGGIALSCSTGDNNCEILRLRLRMTFFHYHPERSEFTPMTIRTIASRRVPLRGESAMRVKFPFPCFDGAGLQTERLFILPSPR